MGLRVDVHDGSSIPTRKVELDLNFINQFFDLNQLKSKSTHMDISDLTYSRHRKFRQLQSSIQPISRREPDDRELIISRHSNSW